MIYPEYCYVDVAIGGARNRNNVTHIDKVNIPPNAYGCYVSMFRFKKEYKELCYSTNPPSVRGASQFLCYSDFIWFDVDSDDLKTAWQDTRKLLLVIKTMELIRSTVVFFSGSKGFHVGIPTTMFKLEPAVNLPSMVREIAGNIAESAKANIDMKIYNHNRLWRIPGSIHQKTENRKIQLLHKEFEL